MFVPFQQNCPFPCGDLNLHLIRGSLGSIESSTLNLHLIRGSLGSIESSTQTASRLVKPFLHSSPQSVPILYNEPPSLLQIAPSHEGCLHGSLGPPESSTQTTSRSVQPFLQGLLYCGRPTDRPTDHASRSVTVGRIYVRSTAMRPNKKKLRIIAV